MIGKRPSLKCSNQCRSGFTLIEILVVVGILGSLVALLLSAVQHVRSAAARLRCVNNLRQVGLALQHYHTTHSLFPPGLSYQDGADPYPFMSWNTRLLPFLERNDLWLQAQQAFAEERNFYYNPPHKGLETPLAIYTCPSDSRSNLFEALNGPKRAFTSYLGVEGIDQFRTGGVLYLDSRVSVTNITDGASTTIAVGERPASAYGDFGWWYGGWGQSQDGSAEMVLGVQELNVSTYSAICAPGPYEFGPGNVKNQCDMFHFWSLHINGGNFLFADGSARFLTYSAAPIMPALSTRRGGEIASVPE